MAYDRQQGNRRQQTWPPTPGNPQNWKYIMYCKHVALSSEDYGVTATDKLTLSVKFAHVVVEICKCTEIQIRCFSRVDPVDPRVGSKIFDAYFLDRGQLCTDMLIAVLYTLTGDDVITTRKHLW